MHAQRIQISGDSCFIKSYAKINLTLDILGRRPDGFHELATVMQAIDLFDTLCLSPLPEDRVEIVCSKLELSNASNLAARAAELIRQRFSLHRGLKIELNKRVPMAAGLGGGSSNAAAVLLALREWWDLPIAHEEMIEMAASLGSDVPFFLTEGLALCRGRGEVMTPIPAFCPPSLRWLIILKPAISVSTAMVFTNLPASDYTDGTHSLSIQQALQKAQEPDLTDLHNGLERNVLKTYPEVAQAREALLDAGASFVRLSGSGPTLFAPFSRLEDAVHVHERLKNAGYEIYISHVIYLN